MTIISERRQQNLKASFGKLCRNLRLGPQEGYETLLDLPSLGLSEDHLEALKVWMEVQKSEGGEIPETLTSLEINISHSSLIQWILLGNKPLLKPPPKYMSRPWHQLIVDGCGWVSETASILEKGWEKVFKGPRVIIGQDAGWKLIEDLGDKTFLVSYYGEDRWIVTQTPPDGKVYFVDSILRCLNPEILWELTLPKEGKEEQDRPLSEEKGKSAI